VLNALEQLKEAMQEVGAKTAKDLVAAGRPTRYVGRKKNDDAGRVDSKIGLGTSFVSDIHGAQMVELEVDIASGQVKIQKITAAVDAGRVFNPKNLTGQLEGGMDQGVGYALREMYVAGKTKDWVTFKFPTAQKSFEMETLVVQTPREKGTLGATGVGEMCLLPTAPAVINAINNAIGVWICDLPATPEKIKAALAEKKQ
jgi:aldehyde oxidoreductase